MLISTGTAYAYTNIIRLALIDYSDFRVIDSNVYLSQSISKEGEDKIISLLNDARERITQHYGEPTAKPVIVVLGTREEEKKYGIKHFPGLCLFVPWNNYLLLSYQKMNIDVIAHELVHTEIVERVGGYSKRELEVPTWFDEGVAMQVDYRPKYISSDTIDQYEFERIITIDAPRKFWSDDKAQNQRNYRAAKSAVFEIFKNTDESLYSMLEKIRRGEASVIVSAVNQTHIVLGEQ